MAFDKGLTVLFNYDKLLVVSGYAWFWLFRVVVDDFGWLGVVFAGFGLL